jgi:uracil DNA glycosylase
MDDITHEQFNIHPNGYLFPEEFATAIELVDSLKPCLPESKDVFNVFKSAPSNVKVVVIGQDPYPTKGDATGLAFSVRRNEKLPKSLQNIFKELQSDLGITRTDGDLSDLAGTRRFSYQSHIDCTFWSSQWT